MSMFVPKLQGPQMGPDRWTLYQVALERGESELARAVLLDHPSMVYAREVDSKYQGDLEAEIADLRAAGVTPPDFPWSKA